MWNFQTSEVDKDSKNLFDKGHRVPATLNVISLFYKKIIKVRYYFRFLTNVLTFSMRHKLRPKIMKIRGRPNILIHIHHGANIFNANKFITRLFLTLLFLTLFFIAFSSLILFKHKNILVSKMFALAWCKKHLVYSTLTLIVTKKMRKN